MSEPSQVEMPNSPGSYFVADMEPSHQVAITNTDWDWKEWYLAQADLQHMRCNGGTSQVAGA